MCNRFNAKTISAVSVVALVLSVLFIRANNTEPTPPPPHPFKEGVGDPKGFSPELKAWLNEKNVKVLALIDNEGQVQIINAEGVELKQCGKTGEPTENYKGLCKRIVDDKKTGQLVELYSNSISLTKYKSPKSPDPCQLFNIWGSVVAWCW